MTLRRKRSNPPLQNILFSVLQAQGQNPAEIDILQYLFKLMKTDKNTQLIDLNYHSQYEPSLGIRFNIECIHNNKSKGFFGALASVMPQASYYDLKSVGEKPKDAFMFVNPNYDSYTGSPKFFEGDEIMLGFTPDKPGMSIIIDIKYYDPEKGVF